MQKQSCDRHAGVGFFPFLALILQSAKILADDLADLTLELPIDPLSGIRAPAVQRVIGRSVHRIRRRRSS